MDEVVPQVGDVDDGLAEELAAEIYRFNGQATGIVDGRWLRIAVRDGDGELEAGLSGWTWVAAVTSTCSGFAMTGVARGSVGGSSPPPRSRPFGAGVRRWR